MIDCLERVSFAPKGSHHVLLHGDAVVFSVGGGRFAVMNRHSGALLHELEYSDNDDVKEVIALDGFGWAVRGFNALDVFFKTTGNEISHNTYYPSLNTIEGVLLIENTGIIMVYEWVNLHYNPSSYKKFYFVAPETAEPFHLMKVPDGNGPHGTIIRKDGSILLGCGTESSRLDKRAFGIEKFKDYKGEKWAFVDGASLSYKDIRKRLHCDQNIVVGASGGEVIGYTIRERSMDFCALDSNRVHTCDFPAEYNAHTSLKLLNEDVLLALTTDPKLLRINLCHGSVRLTRLDDRLSFSRSCKYPLYILENSSDQAYVYDAEADVLMPTPIDVKKSPWFYFLNEETIITKDYEEPRTVRLIDVRQDDIRIREIPDLEDLYCIESDDDDYLWVLDDNTSFRASIRELKECCFND
ncbi:MAG: hypothetical protein R6V59_08155 [Dehalococcoidia bacterium]